MTPRTAEEWGRVMLRLDVGTCPMCGRGGDDG
jgi:hypothetical protein